MERLIKGDCLEVMVWLCLVAYDHIPDVGKKVSKPLNIDGVRHSYIND